MLRSQPHRSLQRARSPTSHRTPRWMSFKSVLNGIRDSHSGNRPEEGNPESLPKFRLFRPTRRSLHPTNRPFRPRSSRPSMDGRVRIANTAIPRSGVIERVPCRSIGQSQSGKGQRFEAVIPDITKLKVYAIVNAANEAPCDWRWSGQRDQSPAAVPRLAYCRAAAWRYRPKSAWARASSSLLSPRSSTIRRTRGSLGGDRSRRTVRAGDGA